MFALLACPQTNITVAVDDSTACLIELGFACVWPVEFLQPLLWLIGKLVDGVRPDKFALAFETRQLLENYKREHGFLIDHVKGAEE